MTENEPYPLEVWVDERDCDFDKIRDDMLHVFDQWRRDHDFMFVKRRDDEDWREFRQQLLISVGLND